MAKKSSSSESSSTPSRGSSQRRAPARKKAAVEPVHAVDTASGSEVAAAAVATANVTASAATPAMPRTPAPVKVIEKSLAAEPPVGADQVPARPLTSPRPVPTYQEIAERAYFLYISGAPGGALDHWLAAERELSSR